MDNKYVKMSELVDSEITIKSIGLAKYVAWDDANGKYITEDRWFKGAAKKYPVTTDKGIVDISQGHIGNMFEGVQHAGQANVIGATYRIKSNGKSGKDIRYFVNPVASPKPEPDILDEDPFAHIRQEEY